MINIIITMGGLGSRFREVGYNIPKYMIKAKEKTLFEWSLISLQSFHKMNPKYIFILRRADNAANFINSICKKLNINDFHVIEIDEVTDGQATTAILAKKNWNANWPLMIYNIDTHIEPGYLHPNHELIDGWIPCFQAPGENWSFAKLDENQNVIEVREKKRISPFATVGLYWFSSAILYESAYNKYYSDSSKKEKGEKYVAPLYNQLIVDNLKVKIFEIPYNRVHVIGTPEELKMFSDSDYNL
jgi:dTDP-glucose pyrophosphorylase